jgi:hypothetical protein
MPRESKEIAVVQQIFDKPVPAVAAKTTTCWQYVYSGETAVGPVCIEKAHECAILC